MSFRDQSRFNTRLETAAEARAATLARFRERPGADDPAMLACQDRRRAVAVARQARAEERALKLLAEAERLAEVALADRKAEAVRRAAAIEAAAERARAEQTRLKADRDARYAARKAKIRLRR